MNKKGSVKRGVVPVRGVALVRCWTQMKGSYLPSGKLAYPTKREKESIDSKVPLRGDMLNIEMQMSQA